MKEHMLICVVVMKKLLVVYEKLEHATYEECRNGEDTIATSDHDEPMGMSRYTPGIDKRCNNIVRPMPPYLAELHDTPLDQLLRI